MPDEADEQMAADRLFRRQRRLLVVSGACILLFAITAVLTRTPLELSGSLGAALVLLSVLAQLGSEGRRRLLRR